MFDWFKKDSKLDKAEIKVQKLEKELAKAKQEEREREFALVSKSKSKAVAHLKAAERYFEQMSQAKGARKSEIKAIVDNRVEKAEQLLGFKVDNITATINRLG